MNGKAELSDDIASNTLRITKGSFVRAQESTQSVHLSSWWHDISNDRMTKHKATDPPDPMKTSSNKNSENDIKGVELNRSMTVTQNSEVIIHVIVRGKAPTISNLFTYNKPNFTAEILENVTSSGSKDSAIQYRRDVKDNSLKELNPLTQTELGQFDHKILSKQPNYPTIFGASRDTKLGDTNTSFEKTITSPKIANSKLGLGEGGRVSNTDHLEGNKSGI